MVRLITLLALVLGNSVYAQNLIQNGGFENNRFCPNIPPRGENNVCPPWIQLGTRNVPATFSFFPNRCEALTNQTIQNSVIPIVRSDRGSAEFGVYAQTVQSVRTNAYAYLTIPLSETLNDQDDYYFEMYVSPNSLQNGNYIAGTVVTDWPLNTFGAYFSQIQPSNFDFGPLANFEPQILNKNPITRTWNRVKGCLKPKGGERFMTIGMINRPNSANDQQGYVDDVVLIKLPREHKISINKCNRNNWELDATLTSSLPEDVPKYKWQNGSTSPKLSVNREGKYAVEVQVECKTYRDTVEVVFLDLGKDTTFCRGQNLPLRVNRTDIWKDYRWSIGASGSALISVSDSGSYWVAATVRNCLSRDTLKIELNDIPQLALPTDTTICINRPLLLRANLSGGTITWPDGSTQNQFIVSQAGVYTVAATNQCGSVKRSISVKEKECNLRIFVPNAFTPNDDGVNDLLEVYIDSYRPINAATLTIFNRWGEVVFQTKDLSQRWDGRYGGQTLSADSFGWKLEVSFQEGEDKYAVLQGVVLLIK